MPTGLTSLSGGGLISLSWDKSSDPDVQGYRVWRKAQGESDFRPLTDQPVPWNAYNDSTAVKGKKYDYAVTAVDAAGNESGKSDIVSERLGGRD